MIRRTRTIELVPAQRQALADDYTWAVNAAVESGDTDLAYELARSYAREV